MKIKLTTNLGSRDAARLKIEPARDGEIIEVSAKVAEALIRKGWATDPSKPATVVEDDEDDVETESTPKSVVKRTPPRGK